MKKRKLLSLIQSVVLLFACFPAQNVRAEEESADVDVWDGTVDTSWYDEDEKEVHIYTAEQLAGIFAHPTVGMTFYLERDMILDGFKWTPKYKYDFAGEFHGQNHKIIGLRDSCLFPAILGLGVVQDLHIEDAHCTHCILASTIYGRVNNCTVDGLVELSKTEFGHGCWVEDIGIGGICLLLAGGTIENCRNYADLVLNVNWENIGNYSYSSSIIYEHDRFNGTYYDDYKSAVWIVGGICSFIDVSSHHTSIIRNCCNYGNLTLKQKGYEYKECELFTKKTLNAFSRCLAIGCVVRGTPLIENCYPLIENCYDTTSCALTAAIRNAQYEFISGGIWGDVNWDKIRNIADAVLLQKVIMTEEELKSEAGIIADLDYNGIINSCDLTLLKRMLIKQ